MMQTVSVPVRTLMDALELQALPSSALNIIDEHDTVDIDVDVDAAECAAVAGYIDPSEAPDEEEITENAIAGMEPCVRDLEDGIAALIAGDRAIASILMCRALDQWPDAARMVEVALRAKVQPDPRQLRFIDAC
ncbi:hypothetical protein [Sphingobium sp. CECT 9361]|uniref:hypothetical protein n=1 Tax=Sphingobium sp. CECT 9361 TaxID=2845384 RepID=UPI001E57FDD0|nr:hypothetical protein [Sphingobium sp. CECT 9361]CAH0355334.1 hypothetical protein SPH9361_03411 [Sphingobium sp. CECT 9361]